LKAGWMRRNGLPLSDRATMTDRFHRYGDVMTHVSIVEDPVYLTEPYIRSQEFVMMERGNTNWLYNCEYVMEVPMDKNDVPMYLPGQNPFIEDFAKKFGLPFEAVFGGAPTTYPDYLPTMERLMNR